MNGFTLHEALQICAPLLIVAFAASALFSLFREDNAAVRALASAIGLALLWRYAWWRATATLPAADFSVDFILGVGFLTLELGGVLSATVSGLTLSMTSNRSKEADENSDWLMNEARCPLVDVVICTYNEEKPILERTVIGAMAMTYPNARVWVLDDGRREWLARLCRRLGCGYIARPTNEHAKAGNVNHALAHLAGLARRADFIAVLDADFVPMPNFLGRAMTLFRKSDVGVVQTPQYFVNPDPIQINLGAERLLPDEQRFFFDVVLPSRDAWGTAFCCGTSAVIRLAPLLAIGGVPTDSVTEDYLLSLRLKEIGFRTVYLLEPLSFGLAPEGVSEYVSQRARWCLGMMQIIRGRSGPLSRSRKIGWVDRMALIDSFLGWAAIYPLRICGLIAPPLCLLFNLQPVHAKLDDVVAYFGAYYVWAIYFGLWISKGRTQPILTEVWQLLAAPEIVRAVFVGLRRPKGHKFVVTDKGGDRSKGFVHGDRMTIYAGLIVFTFFAIGWNFFVAGRSRPIAFGGLAFGWSWFNIVLLSVLGAIAVERPRRRRAERYSTSKQVHVRFAGRNEICELRDISLGGCRLASVFEPSLGEAASIDFGRGELPARVVRILPDGFAVEIEQSLAARIAMTKEFYSGAYLQTFRGVRPREVCVALSKRLLG
jgi:cellulose synthase (UDP-forming)